MTAAGLLGSGGPAKEKEKEAVCRRLTALAAHTGTVAVACTGGATHLRPALTRTDRRRHHLLAAAEATQPQQCRALPPPLHADAMREAFEVVHWSTPQRAAQKFRTFGFCLVGEALADATLQLLRTAAGEVFDEVAAFDVQRSGSRGEARYGLGSMTTHPQWAAHLIDNPRVLKCVDEIWGHSRCELLRCGMNGSFPGSGDQRLHIDISANAFDDSFTELAIQQLPLFSLTVHYPVVDMCSTNGTIRIVPTSNRWPYPIPALEEEPAWMRECEVHCPAGTAILKDVRIWHGGCKNSASAELHPELGAGRCHARPMPNAQYNAPWFSRPGDNMRHLDRAAFEKLSSRGQQLARKVTLPPGIQSPGYLLDAYRQIRPDDKRWLAFLRDSGQLPISG